MLYELRDGADVLGVRITGVETREPVMGADAVAARDDVVATLRDELMADAALLGVWGAGRACASRSPNVESEVWGAGRACASRSPNVEFERATDCWMSRAEPPARETGALPIELIAAVRWDLTSALAFAVVLFLENIEARVSTVLRLAGTADSGIPASFMEGPLGLRTLLALPDPLLAFDLPAPSPDLLLTAPVVGSAGL